MNEISDSFYSSDKSQSSFSFRISCLERDSDKLKINKQSEKSVFCLEEDNDINHLIVQH